VNLLDPLSRSPMRQRGQIRQCRGTQIGKMLPLQVAPRALARDSRDAVRAMIWQD
jgi:hypothetical protein